MTGVSPADAGPAPPPGVRRGAPDPASVAAWALPFVLVVGLAFSGGGYDAVLRGEVGVATWWLVALFAAAGLLRGGTTRAGRWALLLLAAFGAWTALGLWWTDSAERTLGEAGRVSAFVGVLALAVETQARADHARHAVAGLASAIAVVAAAAVLSRLHPSWFPARHLDELLSGSERRLAYPLNYWNLLAGLAAMGIPALLHAASSARAAAARGVALGALPVVGLCIYLTVSRAGIAATVLCVVVFLALAPERPVKILLTAIAGVGTAVLCAGADRRDDLQAGLDTAVARHQGDELLWLSIVVVVVVALAGGVVALLARHVPRPHWTRPTPRTTALATAVVVVLAVAVALASGGAGYADRQFRAFQGPAVATDFDDAFSRLSVINGNGRWQLWQVARRSAAAHPVGGTGAGTYEFERAAGDPGAAGGFVRDAHSLWFQTLGETGYVGLALLGAFFLLAIVGGAARALRTVDREQRTAIAAAVGTIVAFAVTATFEWAWQLTVLPLAALVAIAVALTGGRAGAGRALPGRRSTGRWALAVRVLVPLVALVALAPVVVPLAATERVRASQAQAGRGDLPAALGSARSAVAVQPSAATPRLQEALVLERLGRIPAALVSARAATVREPTNWRTWLVRSRLAARSGDADDSVGAYRRARSLNPRSPIFR